MVSPTEFLALPLRVHALLNDVELHDVWAVDLPSGSPGITLSEFVRQGRTDHQGLPPIAKALFRIRFAIGRIFGWNDEGKSTLGETFASRLTADDRARSLVPPGEPEGIFRVVYRFDNEELLEVTNRTVRGATVQALVEHETGYRLYFAVYVQPVGWWTPLYMAAIDPFRRFIVYPSLLRSIRSNWDRTFGTP